MQHVTSPQSGACACSAWRVADRGEIEIATTKLSVKTALWKITTGIYFNNKALKLFRSRGDHVVAVAPASTGKSFDTINGFADKKHDRRAKSQNGTGRVAASCWPQLSSSSRLSSRDWWASLTNNRVDVEEVVSPPGSWYVLGVSSVWLHYFDGICTIIFKPLHRVAETINSQHFPPLERWPTGAALSI